MRKGCQETINPEAVTVQDCIDMHRMKGCTTDIRDGKVEGFPEDVPPEKKDAKRYPVYALIVRRGKERIQWSTCRQIGG